MSVPVNNLYILIWSMIKKVKYYILEENSHNLTYRNTQAGQNALGILKSRVKNHEKRYFRLKEKTE
jgi:hypothetical protein